MKRLNKYFVLKMTDIKKSLSDEERLNLEVYHQKILAQREIEGRDVDKDYVVVSDMLPFYEDVWKMIEDYVDFKEIEKRQAKLGYKDGCPKHFKQLDILTAISKYNKFIEAVYKSALKPEVLDPQINVAFEALQKKFPGCVCMKGDV